MRIGVLRHVAYNTEMAHCGHPAKRWASQQIVAEFPVNPTKKWALSTLERRTAPR
jgi:hypothetical protein